MRGRDPVDGDMAWAFRLLKPQPRAGRCDRCGAEGEAPLSVVRFEASRLRSTRTVCSFCVGVLFEAFIESPDHADDALTTIETGTG